MSKDTDAEIRGKCVRRMWKDDLLLNTGADPERVADYSVSTSDEKRAVNMLTGSMIDDDDSPVVWLVHNQTVSLVRDKQKIARYIADNLGADKVPWDLEGEL